MSILSKLSKSTLRIALVLSVFTGLVATTNAATTTLPASLRGTYVVKNAVVSVGGFTLPVTIKKVSIPIGSTGLKALTPAKITSILAANGGTGVVVTITSKALKNVSLSATGTFPTKLGTAVLLPGSTGTGVLSANGLKITVNVVGTLAGFPVSGTQTVTLKKQ